MCVLMLAQRHRDRRAEKTLRAYITRLLKTTECGGTDKCRIPRHEQGIPRHDTASQGVCARYGMCRAGPLDRTCIIKGPRTGERHSSRSMPHFRMCTAGCLLGTAYRTPPRPQWGRSIHISPYPYHSKQTSTARLKGHRAAGLRRSRTDTHTTLG